MLFTHILVVFWGAPINSRDICSLMGVTLNKYRHFSLSLSVGKESASDFLFCIINKQVFASAPKEFPWTVAYTMLYIQ